MVRFGREDQEYELTLRKLTSLSKRALALRNPFRDENAKHPVSIRPTPHPGLAVPGDFIISRKYVSQCHANKHFGTEACCWCIIADEIADLSDAFYITERDELCDRAIRIQQGSEDAVSVDCFGNTALHLFAASDNNSGVETTFQLLESGHTDPTRVNNAQQTFLHVLSSIWFYGSDDLSIPLYKLLNLLFARCKSLIYAPDIYGRTFFHQLDRFIHDPNFIENITQHYSTTIPRDAFGIKPPSHAVNTPVWVPSPLAKVPEDEGLDIRTAALIDVINGSYSDPLKEDSEGRNGLHCLAELDFSGPPHATTSQSRSPTTDTDGYFKRNNETDGIDRQAAESIASTFSYLKGLLTPLKEVASPDTNHYDSKGNTVLIAFAARLSNNQDESSFDIDRILDLLIEKGAILDARNRQGETALMVAAKRGNGHVVRNLLDKGANLCARDKRGRAILTIVDDQISLCSKDLPSYGRLEAVRATLLTKMLEKGVTREPTFLDEWTWPLFLMNNSSRDGGDASESVEAVAEAGGADEEKSGADPSMDS